MVNWNSPTVIKERKKWTRTHNVITFDPETLTFTQNNPRPVKHHLMELTKEARTRVLTDFKAIFNREPDKDEVDELLREEFRSIYKRLPNKIEVERMNNKGGNSM